MSVTSIGKLTSTQNPVFSDWNVIDITSSTAWPVPANVSKINAVLVGGGAGGGLSGNFTTDAIAGAGGGGGGGEFAVLQNFDVKSLSDGSGTLYVAIAAGGASRADGGSTYIGSSATTSTRLAWVAGGIAGSTATAASLAGIGGTGGTGGALVASYASLTVSALTQIPNAIMGPTDTSTWAASFKAVQGGNGGGSTATISVPASTDATYAAAASNLLRDGYSAKVPGSSIYSAVFSAGVSVSGGTTTTTAGSATGGLAGFSGGGGAATTSSKQDTRAGNGGSGGGGAGGNPVNKNGGAAAANTGGGGGGSNSNTTGTAGAGGSGRVIIWYRTNTL